jgi:predicted peptidase
MIHWTVSFLLGTLWTATEMPQSPGIHELRLERENEPPLLYTLSLPKRRQKHPPLVIALHYAGHGSPYFGRGMLETLVEPALRATSPVIVAPDCPSSSWTTSASEDLVLALVDLLSETYSVDPRRVVLTGYSMGGMGTWYLAARHPDRFSAAIPMAGSPRGVDLDALKRMPLYAIHSRADEVVGIAPTEEAVRRLKDAGAPVELVIAEGVPHYQTTRFEPYLEEAVDWLRRVWKAGR